MKGEKRGWGKFFLKIFPILQTAEEKRGGKKLFLNTTSNITASQGGKKTKKRGGGRVSLSLSPQNRGRSFEREGSGAISHHFSFSFWTGGRGVGEEKGDTMLYSFSQEGDKKGGIVRIALSLARNLHVENGKKMEERNAILHQNPTFKRVWGGERGESSAKRKNLLWIWNLGKRGRGC